LKFCRNLQKLISANHMLNGCLNSGITMLSAIPPSVIRWLEVLQEVCKN